MTGSSYTQAPPLAVLEAVRRWGLVLGEPTDSRYSHTWLATRGGEHVVVKVGDPLARRREAAALGVYARGGATMGLAHPPACAVLASAHSEESAALLLERVVPGYDLRPLARQDDDAAMAAIGQVMAQLHAAAAAAAPGGVPSALPELATIDEAFDPPRRHAVWPAGESAPGLDPALVEHARGLLAELAAPSPQDTVLHGDLHHANIVCDGGPAWRGMDHPEREDWRAIDPHGWLGDPHFDAVSTLLDLHGTAPQAQLSDSEVRVLARRRAAILAEVTGLDAQRIEAWAMVGAVISELWCLADHGFVQGPPHRLAGVLLPR